MCLYMYVAVYICIVCHLYVYICVCMYAWGCTCVYMDVYLYIVCMHMLMRILYVCYR